MLHKLKKESNTKFKVGIFTKATKKLQQHLILDEVRFQMSDYNTHSKVLKNI